MSKFGFVNSKTFLLYNVSYLWLLCGISSAHIDVVPAHADSWSVDDPFSGELKEENGTTYIFGRGAMDDKGSLMAILEALEFRLSMGELVWMFVMEITGEWSVS